MMTRAAAKARYIFFARDTMMMMITLCRERKSLYNTWLSATSSR